MHAVAESDQHELWKSNSRRRKKIKRCQHVQGSDLESSHHTRSNPGVIHEAPQITAILHLIVNPNPTSPPIQIYRPVPPHPFRPTTEPIAANRNKNYQQQKKPDRSPNPDEETQPQQITRRLRHPALLRGRSPADQRGGKQLRPVKPGNHILANDSEAHGSGGGGGGGGRAGKLTHQARAARGGEARPRPLRSGDVGGGGRQIWRRTG
ncbi:hypothetical protein PVAP13_2KG289767 [Panicum virgatum]|uniref:Uncharacterized protein n=1 Tax=Panicum virgatum TaxID=38727 RepID=A0A8T0WC48_PANVG|nr:hypothetical protein PVAP13_2KG289767 [Panicum virgatum]